jgi:hypothetical protein
MDIAVKTVGHDNSCGQRISVSIGNGAKKPQGENDMRFLYRTAGMLLHYGTVVNMVGRPGYNFGDYN